MVSQPSDIRLSFNEAAEIYDAVRPSYPAETFDALFEMLPSNPTVVEVAPGIGQATRDLLARGAAVHAIEIGPSIAAKLRSNPPVRSASNHRRRLRPDVDRTQISGSGVLRDGVPLDLVAGADGRRASILRPGGVVAIVDLVQVASPDDAGCFEAVQPIRSTARSGCRMSLGDRGGGQRGREHRR